MNGPGQDRSVVEYGFRRIVVTFAIIIATLLEIVDTTIINVALPNIQGNFGAALDEAAWISTGYIIANVVVIPITPWLQMRFGRKQYYIASILIFVVASAMCGLANDIWTLVFWRIIQGLGGGGLISTSQAILRETFPQDKQGAAAGIFAMGVIVGPTIGPTLGGLITDNASWRWAFYINVPLGLLAAALAFAYLRNPAKPRKMPIDFPGLFLLAIGVASLQYVLDQGQTKDWFADDSIVACSISAVIALVAFVIWELWTDKPIVDLRIFRHRSVSAGAALGFCLGISLYGSILILPQYVQSQLHYTATLSGELLVFRAAFVLVLTPIAAALAQRGKIDPRIMIAMGFLLLGIGQFMLFQVTTTTAGFWTFFWPLALSGVGLSQIFVPLTLAVLGNVKGREIASASAVFNLSRQLGGSAAIAGLVTLLARQQAAHHDALAAIATLPRPSVQKYLNLGGTLAHLNDLITAQAAVMSYGDAAIATAVVTIAFVPLVLLMRRPPRASAPVHAD
jgi:DHA2 family multidrug resistance protein